MTTPYDGKIGFAYVKSNHAKGLVYWRSVLKDNMLKAISQVQSPIEA
jgi:hypothetical protein